MRKVDKQLKSDGYTLINFSAKEIVFLAGKEQVIEYLEGMYEDNIEDLTEDILLREICLLSGRQTEIPIAIHKTFEVMEN